jgi:hypothetical protein
MIPALDGQAAFRATFLLNLDPGHAETLRATGDLLEFLFKHLENDAESETAHLQLHEQAVVADLRYAANRLGWIAKHTTATELSVEQFAIAARATALAPRLLRLIEEMGGAPVMEGKTEQSSARERLSIRSDFWVRIPMPLANRVGLEPEGEVEWEVVPEGLLLRRVILAIKECGGETP